MENNVGDNISPWRTPAEILNLSVNIPWCFIHVLILTFLYNYLKIHNMFPCKPSICNFCYNLDQSIKVEGGTGHCSVTLFINDLLVTFLTHQYSDVVYNIYHFVPLSCHAKEIFW